MTNNNRVPIGAHVTIYTRGKRGLWTAEFQREGKHCRQSLKTPNKKIATQRAIRIEHELSTGTFKPSAPKTRVDDAKQQYVRFLRVEGRAEKTVVRYEGELKAFGAFCEEHGIQRLAQVSPTLVDAYRAHRLETHHPRTVHHETMVIKSWLRWCETRRLIAENPLCGYLVSKPISDPKPAPTLAEVQRILAAAKPQRRLQFAVLAFTGMRVGDLRRLRPEDVDRRAGWFQVMSRPGAETKTRRSRKIPMHPVLTKLLADNKPCKGCFFFCAEASPKYPEGDHQISDKKLNEEFQRTANRLGMPIGRESGYTLHALRRFFETFCINSGIPQRAVDVWMGHVGDKSMGAVYYSLSDAESQSMMGKVPFSLGIDASEGTGPN